MQTCLFRTTGDEDLLSLVIIDCNLTFWTSNSLGSNRSNIDQSVSSEILVASLESSFGTNKIHLVNWRNFATQTSPKLAVQAPDSRFSGTTRSSHRTGSLGASCIMHHAVLLQVSQYSNVSIKLEIWNRQLQSYTVETWNNLAVEHPWSQNVSTWHLKRITFQSGTPTPLAVEPQTSTVAAFIPFSVLLVPKVRCIYVHLLHLERFRSMTFWASGIGIA